MYVALILPFKRTNMPVGYFMDWPPLRRDNHRAYDSWVYHAVLTGHSKIDNTKIIMTNGSLMKVESIAECSPLSILQYFLPALSENWSWKPILGLFESGRFWQVLLYI